MCLEQREVSLGDVALRLTDTQKVFKVMDTYEVIEGKEIWKENW